MSTASQKNDIAQLFTATERTTLRTWLDLDVGGHEEAADRFLNAGLQLEHFQSRLADIPSERSAEDLAQMHNLQSQFENELELAREILAEDNKTQSTSSIHLNAAELSVIKHFFGFTQ